MEQFITQNPDLIYKLISLFGGIFGVVIVFLLSIIGFFLKRSLDNNTKAINDLEKYIKEVSEKCAEHEGHLKTHDAQIEDIQNLCC